MGREPRRPDVLVTEPCLHGTDVIPRFESMGGKGMPEGISTLLLIRRSSVFAPLPSLLWSDRPNRPVVTTSDFGEAGHPPPRWPGAGHVRVEARSTRVQPRERCACTTPEC
jgi:hypothetical protein